ncbi:MAG: SusD/RagB family nutrient-binding outer membrane lipoprotein [Candidatus Nephrothrix sp. EaCA]|nr:MAG: SusD/RagB family nutrient-binding outer membrane lipoprotein [Candidatus Nephrothrix sp. EaCA]
MKTWRTSNKSWAVLITIMALTSCTRLFQGSDLDQNPNSPVLSEVDLSSLTRGTLVGLGWLHEDQDVRIAYMWGGQLKGQGRQSQGFGTYTVSAFNFDWSSYYNTGANIRLIQQKASADNNKVQLGAGQVMEALLFTKLISLWGDVPYSEAFDIVNHPTPKYDEQLSIYNELITLLSTAYTNLNSGTGTITGDFIYRGEASLWAAAAKTLQARLYLHLKDYTNAAAAAALGIKSLGAGFSGGGGDMLMPHGTAYQVDINSNNAFFDVNNSGDCSFDPPAYLPVFMCTNLVSGTYAKDLALRNVKTDETGMYFHFFAYGSKTKSTNLEPNSRTGFFVAKAPQPWLTFYENQLILAESKARLSRTGTADPAALAALNTVRTGLASGYINGLTADPSLLKRSGKITCASTSKAVVGVKTKFTTEFIVNQQIADSVGNVLGTISAITDDYHLILTANSTEDIPLNRSYKLNGLVYDRYVVADFSQGGIANPGKKFPDGNTALLTEIASEKFVTLLSQYEVFNELRRLQAATPTITLGIPIINGSKYPARYIYPQQELNTNPNCPNPAPDQFVRLPVFQ